VKLIKVADILELLSVGQSKFHADIKRRPGFPRPFPGMRGRYVAEQVDAWIASQAEPQG
jgi:predicted DNA-binding transcriptional regulator AlpA